MDDTGNSAVSAPVEAPSAPALVSEPTPASALAAPPGQFGLSPARIGEIASDLAVQKSGAPPATVAEPGYSDPSRAFQARTPAPAGRIGLAPDQINKIAADLALQKAGAANVAEDVAPARFDPAAFFEANPDDYYGFIRELRQTVAGVIGEEGAVELLFAFGDLYRDELLEYFHEWWLSLVAPHVNPADLADLPKDLQAFVPRLRAETWEELAWMNSFDRLRTLRQLKNDVEAAEQSYQQERDERENGLKNYYQQQMQGLEQIASQYEAEHRQAISDWAPYGDDAKANPLAQARIMNAALGTMMTAPKMRETHQHALEDIELAGIYVLQSRQDLADMHITSALRKVDEWNTRFRAVLSARLMDQHTLIYKAAQWDKLEAEKRGVEEAEQALMTPINASTVTPDRQPGRFKIPPERLKQIVDYARKVANVGS